ncbi:MAG: M50 family metallopeptidase [Fimbriimonadales bacterium]|nr:M50 family metallopeptidase [Fimbriimonadales bacterium]
MQSPRALSLQQRAFCAACAASAAVWFLPWLQGMLAPLVVFNTIVHEGAHALAAVATGGSVRSIGIAGGTGNGVTLTQGGVWWIVVSAGYLGATALGVWMVGWVARPPQARRALWALCLLFAALTLLWVRGDALGWALAALWSVGLGLAARFLQGMAALFLVQFLGVQQCLQSVQSLLVLGGISAQGHTTNDAAILAEGTGVPALFWALLWTVLGFWALWIGFRRAAGVRSERS